MIAHIDMAGINLELSDDIKKYIIKKVGRLDRFIPRHARKTVRVEVKIKHNKDKAGNKYTCEIIVHLPMQQLQVKEATLNMFAAVDIVEQKLKNQLVKYKQLHSRGSFMLRLKNVFAKR